MRRLVLLVEERSMKETLDVLLPQILPQDFKHLCIPHEGKQDLEKSLPIKLRGWKEPDVKFLVLRDKDAADCKQVKSSLMRLCAQAGRPDTVVRIVCRELEAWFLGDLEAVETGLGIRGLVRRRGQKKFRDPDLLGSPAQELRNIAKGYQKISGARAIAQHMVPERNTSHSFHVFWEAVRKITSN